MDVACTFGNLRAPLANVLKLGIKWNGNYYLDMVAVFSWIHSSTVFQLLSNAIVFIMAKRGYPLFAYISDLFCWLANLGTPSKFFTVWLIFSKNLVEFYTIVFRQALPPCKRLTCLGITVYTRNDIISIDQDKLMQIHDECTLLLIGNT